MRLVILICLILKKKQKVKQSNNGTKSVEIAAPLKYFSNFWRTIEMPLINCEIILILVWSTNCVIVSTNNANQATILCSIRNFINSR